MSKKHNAAVVTGLCAAYFICNFTKLSPSAVMPEIQAEMNLSSSVTGIISGIYFLSYAVMQFFVGPLCGKFSAPKVIGAAMFVSATGLLLFSFGNSVFLLALGRFLIGLGTSPCFIGIVFYFQQCYSGKDYVKAYGIALVASNIGSACASAPLKALLGLASRNVVFVAIAAVAAFVGLFILVSALFSGEKTEKSSAKVSLLSQVKNGVVCILRTPVLFFLLLYWFIESAMLMSYQGLWCIKWTTEAFPAYGIPASFSGIAVSVGLVISSTFGDRLRLYGPFAKRNSSWEHTFYSSGWLCFFSVVLSASVKLVPMQAAGIVLSLVLDVLFGYAGGIVVFHGGVIAKEHAPEGLNANIMGINNGFGCIVQQLSQWATGFGVDVFARHVSHNVAFCCTYYVMAALVLVIVLFSRNVLIDCNKITCETGR